MILPILLLALRATADVVSWEPPVAPLRRLMPQLAELCHAPIKVSPAMQDEVLCVAVHDVSPTDLLARVAAATGGKWVADGDRTWLASNAALRGTLSRKGLETRTKRIQRDIDGFPKHARPWYGPPSTVGTIKGSDQAIDPVKFKSSGQELFSKLVHTVGAKAIAAVPVGGRVVYSTNPTPRQLELGADVSIEAAEYLRARPGNPKRGAEAAYKLTFSVSYPWNSWPAARGILVLRFTIYDAQGSEIATKKYVLDGGGIDGSSHFESRGDGQAFLVSEDDVPAKNDGPDDGKIELSAAAASFFGFVRDFEDEGNPVAQAESRKCLLHPDLTDPLAYPAEELVGAARAGHLQLVASLPDQFFAWCFRSTPLTKPKDVLRALERDASLSAETSNGWLTIACTDFSCEPANRLELERLSKKYVGKIDISMDDLFELGGTGFGQPRGSLTEAWLELASPVLLQIRSDEDWPLFALLLEIDPIKRNDLLAGHGALFGELSIGARSVGEALVYGFWLNKESLEIGADPSDPAPQGALKHIPEDIRMEPTELAPNGVPAWGRVTVHVEHASAIRPAGRKAFPIQEFRFMGGMTAEDLAMYVQKINRNDSGNEVVSLGFKPDVAAFQAMQIGTRTTYRFRIYASRDAFRECSFMVPAFPSPDVFSLSTLPKQFQDEVNAALTDYKGK